MIFNSLVHNSSLRKSHKTQNQTQSTTTQNLLDELDVQIEKEQEKQSTIQQIKEEEKEKEEMEIEEEEEKEVVVKSPVKVKRNYIQVINNNSNNYKSKVHINHFHKPIKILYSPNNNKTIKYDEYYINTIINNDNTVKQCDICRDVINDDEENIIKCKKCNVVVHSDCVDEYYYKKYYSNNKNDFICQCCNEGNDSTKIKCKLCGKSGGYFIKSNNNNNDYCHMCCYVWIPEPYLEKGMIFGLDRIDSERYLLKCSVCGIDNGYPCIQVYILLFLCFYFFLFYSLFLFFRCLFLFLTLLSLFSYHFIYFSYSFILFFLYLYK